ncbi:cAMP-dependent protein kinase type II regulatory subunit [Sitodiplosis mosellana]|uniref:cAMP-dependent protein kinase type II regulatory subunit n=1 Tax=Sitodiplosis mosellana TaxID=263140 RepID=UPI00244456B4|nr:cAMP-dependent protein kinase type II regulatory subunit [Sitodiplosis mosellana]
MSNQPKQRIQVPDSLRDILLEFSIAYLLEQPGDVIDYAVEFFTKLQENRKSKISHDDVPPSPDESIMSLDEEPLVNRFATRRKSVFAETYDPENDADEDEGAAAIFPKSDEQRARLIESVKNILLFRSLDKEQVNQILSFFFHSSFEFNYERMNLADALGPKSFSKGDRIIKQGDAADGMYFIEDGSVSIRIEQDAGEVEISVLSKGQYFGELALVTHRPRAASAYAASDVKVAFLDVDAFERLLGPCMDLMKRSIGDYETQLIKIFGSKNNITDIR